MALLNAHPFMPYLISLAKIYDHLINANNGKNEIYYDQLMADNVITFW